MTENIPGLVDLNKVRTIKAVAKELKKLNNLPEHLGLDQFKLFNNSYLIVTTSVQKSIDDSYFENPKIIEKFIVTFVSYYFEAINNASKNITLPWSKVNEYMKNKS